MKLSFKNRKQIKQHNHVQYSAFAEKQAPAQISNWFLENLRACFKNEATLILQTEYVSTTGFIDYKK